MKIGTIKKYLEHANPEVEVIFDFCRCFPTTVKSWRGIYAEPAIGWSVGRYSGGREVQPLSVKNFLKELNLATSGNVYTGWKGGDFTYTDEDTLHVDNAGDCTHTEISYVEIGDYAIILHTQAKDD